jgi:U32 family peptidase
MVPVSEINEARRQATDALTEARLATFDRKPVTVTAPEPQVAVSKKKKSKAQLSVQVDTVEQAQAALQAGADWLLVSGERYQRSAADEDIYRRLVGMARKAGCRIQCNLPRIVRGKGEADARKRLQWFSDLKVDAVGVSNPGTLAMAREIDGLSLYADVGFNVFNHEAISFLRAQGLVGAVLSPELTLAQVENLVIRTDFPLECLVHGRIPLMVSEFCVGGGYLGDVGAGGCDGVCHEEELFLRDRMGERFPVKTDDECRMHILNAKNLSMLPFLSKLSSLGLDRLRIDAVHMGADETGRITAAYRNALDGGVNGDDEADGNTRGHYFRGVL